MKKGFALLVVLALLVPGFTGCVTTDSGRTKAEGTAVGAGAGAAVGALVGYMVGGGKGAAIGAAIGAGTGAVAGFAYGTHVASEKEKYATQEDWLDDCIVSLDKTNKETKAYNEQLAKNIEELDRETARLAAAYQNKSVEKTALRAEKEKIDARLAEAQEKLKRAKWELENQEKVLAEAQKDKGQGGQVTKLDTEIANLKKQIASLEGHTEELASLSSRMSV